MRTPPTGLLTSPTQCTAALIELTNGTKFGLSDAQVPFVYGGVTYQTIQGVKISPIATESGTSVDNLDVDINLDDARNYILTADVIGRRFEDSRWTMFQIDYTNPGNGRMIVGVYRIAKASFTDTRFKMELLGLLSFLKQMTGRSYRKTCDVLRFGDMRCDPQQTVRTALSASRTVGAVLGTYITDFFGDSRAADFYSFGDATWTGGVNTLLVDQIKRHTVLTPAVYVALTTYGLGDYATTGGHTYYSLANSNTGHTPTTSPTWWHQVTGNPASVARIFWKMPGPAYTISVGDVATLCFGCDRKKDTCESVPNASNSSTKNIENFKGVYLPSPDEMLQIGKGDN